MKYLLLTFSALVLIGCTPNAGLSPNSQTAKVIPSSKKAMLQLDTGGHTALIGDVIVTKDKKIITASDDKTIRIWNSVTGKEERKILGQIGVGSEGKIYAIALSPSEDFLAVGGFLADGDSVNDDLVGSIRIYNYQTGKLLKILKSHTNVVYDLAFSPDGKLLISGSGDFTAKIWEMENLTLKDTIYFHKDSVYAVKLLQVGSDYRAVTAGDDNQIVLYSLKRKKVIKRDSKNYQLMYLAKSNEHIAVCGEDREIQIYDYNLNPVITILSEIKPAGLSYSSNGLFLISGTLPRDVNIYHVAEDYQKISTFEKHKNLTKSVAFLDNKTAVSTGGNNNEIYLWDRETTEVKQKIVGVGEAVWSVGVLGAIIAWGNEWTITKGKTKLQKTFNLTTMKVSQTLSIKSEKFKRARRRQGGLNLYHTGGGSYGYGDAILELKKGQSTLLSSIERDATNGLEHMCYGFYKNMIISGGVNGILKVYNFKGQEIANLVGHTGVVWSIALDGDRLVSGSDDQTIRVWDLSKLKINSEKLKINEYHLAKVIKERKLTREQIIEISKIDNYLNNYIYTSLNYYPQLNLFITKKNEWIAWTPEGFYNASKGAEKYIGYHINQGANKEAEFLNISRFKKQFYRPDLIQKAIAGEDLSSYAKDIDIDSLLKAGLPPKVKILNSAGDIADNELKIAVDVCDQGGGHENLQFYVDKTPIKYLKQTKDFGAGANGNCTVFTQVLLLPSGEHKIGVDATNKEGNIISNTSSILINNTKVVAKKPNLHILTISVADYKDDSLDLRYPNNDASKMIAKLKAIKGSVFGKVFEHSLVDSEVDYESIKKKADEISANVDVEDVFVLFVSGHGVSKDGNYYFIPYACKREANVKEEAISHEQLTNVITRVGTNKIVILLDTCDSGSMATAVKRFGSDIHSAIISGTTSKQSALDGYKEHGMFTYTLLDAMNKTEYYGADKELSVSEIAAHAKYLLPKIAKKSNHVQEVEFFMNGDILFSLGSSE